MEPQNKGDKMEVTDSEFDQFEKDHCKGCQCWVVDSRATSVYPESGHFACEDDKDAVYKEGGEVKCKYLEESEN